MGLCILCGAPAACQCPASPTTSGSPAGGGPAVPGFVPETLTFTDGQVKRKQVGGSYQGAVIQNPNAGRLYVRFGGSDPTQIAFDTLVLQFSFVQWPFPFDQVSLLYIDGSGGTAGQAVVSLLYATGPLPGFASGALGAPALTVTAPGAVDLVGSQSIVAGSVNVGTGAQAIGSSTACREVLVEADPDNTDDVFVGSSTAQTIQLTPGRSAAIQVNDVAKVYARAASGTQTVNWLART